MKKIITVVLWVFMMQLQHSVVAQITHVVYADGITATAATATVAAAKALKVAKGKTKTDYGTIGGVGTALKTSTSWLGTPTAWIDFDLYEDLCSGYKSPGKKTLCNARKDYLQASYETVLDLVSVSTKEKINNGVIEQIWEKYASICNLILKDLDRMRKEAEETSALSAFGYKK